jgi:hypothetical protein
MVRSNRRLVTYAGDCQECSMPVGCDGPADCVLLRGRCGAFWPDAFGLSVFTACGWLFCNLPANVVIADLITAATHNLCTAVTVRPKAMFTEQGADASALVKVFRCRPHEGGRRGHGAGVRIVGQQGRGNRELSADARCWLAGSQARRSSLHSITSETVAILVYAATLEGWYLLQGQAVAISRTTDV